MKKPASKKTKTKASPKVEDRDGDGTSFKGYSLLELPRSAWPQPGKNNGQHGYTPESNQWCSHLHSFSTILLAIFAQHT